MENKKKVIMVVLSVLVCVMAVGYAVLAQRLNITGRASIDSTWRVEITNIQESEVTGSAVSKVTPSYTSTTANFSVGLTSPGDSITYNVEISNLGTLNAKVDSINVAMDENDAIKYTTTGISNGDKLTSGEKATLTVKVEYDSSVTSQPSKTNKDITVTINYIQDVAGEADTPNYNSYAIGDEVTLKDNSTWIVVSDSGSDVEHVTLMKKDFLSEKSVFDSNTSYGYQGSRIEYVLNNDYLPTLKDTTDFIWDDNSSIRLLSWDEYVALKSVANSNEWLYGTEYWWAVRSDGLRALVYPDGSINEDSSGYSNQVRPVITTNKSNII